MRVAVLGAGGQLGREVVTALLPRGHMIAAVMRRPAESLFASVVEARPADARNESEVQEAIRDCEAVVNVIGGGTLRRNDIASSASAIVVPAIEALGIKRYIAMSAGMVALD
jgi:putative NADH-flavin reductase